MHRCVRDSRNFAEILCAQGFVIPTKSVKVAGSSTSAKSSTNPMNQPPENRLPYQLQVVKYDDSDIPTDGIARKETSMKKSDLKTNIGQGQDLGRSQSSENTSKVNNSSPFVPRINVLLRESSRPDSWYTSWRIAPNMTQIGVSKSTFESLAQEYAHLQQQVTKLSGQKGFDLKTNLVS